MTDSTIQGDKMHPNVVSISFFLEFQTPVNCGQWLTKMMTDANLLILLFNGISMGNVFYFITSLSHSRHELFIIGWQGRNSSKITRVGLKRYSVQIPILNCIRGWSDIVSQYEVRVEASEPSFPHPNVEKESNFVDTLVDAPHIRDRNMMLQ